MKVGRRLSSIKMLQYVQGTSLPLSTVQRWLIVSLSLSVTSPETRAKRLRSERRQGNLLTSKCIAFRPPSAGRPLVAGQHDSPFLCRTRVLCIAGAGVEHWAGGGGARNGGSTPTSFGRAQRPGGAHYRAAISADGSCGRERGCSRRQGGCRVRLGQYRPQRCAGSNGL